MQISLGAMFKALGLHLGNSATNLPQPLFLPCIKPSNFHLCILFHTIHFCVNDYFSPGEVDKERGGPCIYLLPKNIAEAFSESAATLEFCQSAVHSTEGPLKSKMAKKKSGKNGRAGEEREKRLGALMLFRVRQ